MRKEISNDFNTRVNYAIACMKKKRTGTRSFDNCFEMWDGDYVVTAILRRALKNPEFEIVLRNYLRTIELREDWEQTAKKFENLSNKELKIEADEHRAKKIAESEERERNWEEQEKKATELRESGSCKHPPVRLYSGFSYSPETGKDEMWVGCCDCGVILIGGAKLDGN
jgi:hypothetical protein